MINIVDYKRLKDKPSKTKHQKARKSVMYTTENTELLIDVNKSSRQTPDTKLQ